MFECSLKFTLSGTIYPIIFFLFLFLSIQLAKIIFSKLFSLLRISIYSYDDKLKQNEI